MKSNNNENSDSDSNSNSESQTHSIIESEDTDIESIDDDQNKIKMLKNLKYDFESYEIKYIYETYLKNQEINLSPSYQREFSWSNEKQDLFIDSIINNYIIPPIILIKLNTKKGYKYECMDGQHRLTVLKNYIEGKPINPVLPHFIKYSKRNQEDEITSVYYKKTDEIEKSNDKKKRYMTEDELNVFNDKKLIIIKISNYDTTMSETFDKIKNEMFVRLQKGETVSKTDILRNYDHPLINVLRKHNLLTWKTFVDDETYNKLSSILNFKTKKTSQKLSQYMYFIIKCLLIIKKDSINIGLISDNAIRDDIMKKATSKADFNRFIFPVDVNEEEFWDDYLTKFRKFMTRVWKLQKEHNLPQFNENFLLIMQYKYCKEKDSLNECLESYPNIKDFNQDKYYKNVFTKKVKGKNLKVLDSKFLEETVKDLDKKITENSDTESEAESEESEEVELEVD